MVDDDLDALLQRGYWSSSRARSPDPRSSLPPSPGPPEAPPHRSFVYSAPLRTPPRNRNRVFPPAPYVEDEEEALAKEHGHTAPTTPKEEPIHRGDPEQLPILLPIHEYNPERRFVLVSSPADSVNDRPEPVKKLPLPPKSRAPTPESDSEPKPDPEYENGPISYEANTGRKYDGRSRREEQREERHEEKSKVKRNSRSNLEAHRDKLDHLPAIVTDMSSQPRSPDARRPKSTARSDKVDDDYFSPRQSSRFQAGGTLSPDVIEHSSRGRDRAYYHGGADPYNTQDRNRSAHPYVQYEKSPPDDKRYKDKAFKLAKSASPNHHKRRSTADLSQQQTKPLSRLGDDKPRPFAELSPSKTNRERERDRNGYARYEQNITSNSASQISLNSNSMEKRGSPPRGEYFYSSDEEVPHQDDRRRRRDSVISIKRKPRLKAPIELKPSDSRRSVEPSPLPSPRTSLVYEREVPPRPSSPRSPPLPKDIRFSRSNRRNQQPLTRPPTTVHSQFNSSAPGLVPAAVAATTTGILKSGSTDDLHRVVIPPPPPPRSSAIQASPRSSASSLSLLLSSSPQRHAARQSQESSSLREVTNPTQVIRRYFDEVQAGKYSDRLRCPRRKAAIGYVDWLTLPHCDNFHICPSCYDTTFSRTEFAHHFVPAPFRGTDRAIACDFGSSEFYHIACFLTVKYRKSDLSLFRNIATIAAQSQPCTGAREASRIWYSVKDGRSQQQPADQYFHVCYTCAKTVEVLLPNLTGLFSPMDSPAEPMRGVCAMHQQNERRFLFYFDLLEAAADKALVTRGTPDVLALADKLREMALATSSTSNSNTATPTTSTTALAKAPPPPPPATATAPAEVIPKCAHDRAVPDGRWYTMRSIPDFTVCEACFEAVVWPAIQADPSSIAANFHQHYTRLPLAACQLYSQRMRGIFDAAVRDSDMRLLGSAIRERRARELEYHDRIAGLDQARYPPAWIEDEVERAVREWQKWE